MISAPASREEFLESLLLALQELTSECTTLDLTRDELRGCLTWCHLLAEQATASTAILQSRLLTEASRDPAQPISHTAAPPAAGGARIETQPTPMLPPDDGAAANTH